MNGPHSPWPLFSDDLDLAGLAQPQLQGTLSLRTGHIAISLGPGMELAGACNPAREQMPLHCVNGIFGSPAEMETRIHIYTCYQKECSSTPSPQ